MAEEEPASTDLALALATHAALFRQLQKRQASTDDQGIAVKYDVNSRCSRSGLTPLFVSCLKGDPASVQLLLAFGADAAAECDVLDTLEGVGEDEKYKEFPLSIATREGHEVIVELLLAHKSVDANQATSDTGSTALYESSRAGNGAICKMLLKQDEIDVNKAMKCGATPLFIACQHGRIEVVTMLLAYDGIDVNKANIDYGATPLYMACNQGRAAVVKMLLAHDGIEVNKSRTDSDDTPLCTACANGQDEIVKMLLGHDGIEVNKARTDGGDTPLSMACFHGRSEVVKMLLAHNGIEVLNATTADGASSLYAACYNGHAAVVKMLLAYDGIEVNKATTDDGTTPLYTACFSGHVEVVKVLLAHDGIEVNKVRADEGATPLHIACDQGQVDVLRVLLADGRADLHKAQQTDGCSPLHAAALGGNLLVAQLLVVHGASLTVADDDGDSPAAVAEMVEEPVLTKWLTSISTWPQLRVAAGCRLYKDAAVALRHGTIDPDDPAKASIKEIMEAIATSKAEPTALPWQDAPPLCKNTVKLVADATRGWSRTNHWLHHGKVREAVLTVLVVTLRLERKDALLEAAVATAAAAAGKADAGATAQLPGLPIEMWIYMMRFFMRSWWKV